MEARKDQRAMSDAEMQVKLEQFKLDGSNFDEELRKCFPLFDCAAPKGHPYPEAFSVNLKLQNVRKKLSDEIYSIASMVKKMRKTEDEEFTLSEKCEVCSIQHEYHEVPMPHIGVISTYRGPMAAAWAMIPAEIVDAFLPFSDDED